MRSQSFPADEGTPSAARRFARGALDGHVSSSTVDVAVLIVSELVTNAVLHAGRDVDVAIDLDDGGVLVVVSDAGGGQPAARRPAADEPTGRGLNMVDQLSDDWGTERRATTGKAVWARIRDRA